MLFVVTAVTSRIASDFHKVSPEVLYANNPAIVVLSEPEIEGLITDSRNTTRRRMRICSHADTKAPVHEMVIVHERGTYVPPHRHLDRSESFHVIKGKADIVVFDDDQSVRAVIPMGEYGSHLAFYYRLNESLFHTLYIHSEVFVFHETGVGPFDRTKSQTAPWAPEESDIQGVSKFMNRLESIIKNHKG